jgi:hypothetical protein
MMRAQKGGIKRLRTMVAAVAVLGLMVVISPPVGLTQPGDTIAQQISEANTPADYHALATWYEQKAQAAHQPATRHFLRREVYAAARATQQKDRAGEHWAFIAKQYQEMAKEDEIFAAMHTMVDEQRK